MTKYENSITLARLFDGRDGTDGGSGYSMSFSSEEILKIPNGVEDRDGKRVPKITYAPASLPIKILFGENPYDIESNLNNITTDITYYGFDDKGIEVSFPNNLQNSLIKTRPEQNKQNENTITLNNAFNGLLVYSYEAKAFLFNPSVINYDNIYYYQEEAIANAPKYTKEVLYQGNIKNISKDEAYYINVSENPEVEIYEYVENPTDEEKSKYVTRTINYIENQESGTYFKAESEVLKNLVDLIVNNDGFFKIRITVENKEIVEGIPLRTAMPSELATFSVHAAGIDAAIANTKLNFDANGLTITNGGFTIKNKAQTNVLMADSEGNLQITGHIIATSGEFTGTIHATSGSFKGKIEANSGTIGGFTINEQSITAGENLQLISDENGSKIIVKNIDIGAGAKIDDTLAIGGNVFLYNPDKHDDLVLMTDSTENQNYTALYKNGHLRIASVTAPSWSVDETGLATFNKVKMSSAEIGTSVMSVDTVQAVGSSMVFKPSYIITTIRNVENKAVISLQGANEEKELLSVDDIVLIANGQNFIYAQVTDVEVSTHEYTLDKALELATYATADDASKSNSICTNLGSTKDFVFTISSNISNETSLFKNNALVLAEINDYILGTPDLNSRILLGSLKSLGDDYSNEFGLYAENVYLNGSLTTRTDSVIVEPAANDGESPTESNKTNGTYAGINTLNGASFSAPEGFSSTDNSKIVFWAGSKGTSNDSIQMAPFQVTEAGTLYAQQGYFEGSIITNANIEASKISAASFWAKGAEAALKLYNTASSDGILFMEAKRDTDGNFVPADDDKYSFGINSAGFYLPAYNYFISCADDSSGVNIKAIKIDAQQLKSNELNLSSSNPKIVFQDLDETGSTNGSIEYNQGIQLRISDNTNLEVLQNGSIALNSNQTLIKNKVSFVGTGATLEYRATEKDQIDKGYDLYVII